MRLTSCLLAAFLIFGIVLHAGQLHDAANEGDFETVRSLIESGEDVNGRDDQGATALMWASLNGRSEVVRLLLSNQADVNMSTEGGKTALLLATSYNEDKVVAILVNSGADVNAKDPTGLTGLHLAVIEDNGSNARLFVENGADINARQEKGTTALYLAANKGNVDLVRFLLQNGADPNLFGNQFDESPLLTAALNQSLDRTRYRSVIELLLEYGARDNWLSSIVDFDPLEFEQLTLSVNDKGTVTVGSAPFILGRHNTIRPWTEPRPAVGTSGTNFFRWGDESKTDAVTVIVIHDERQNSTSAQVWLPAFIGGGGMVYTVGVVSVEAGGPFAMVEVVWEERPPTGIIMLETRGESIELTVGEDGIASFMLEGVERNEPIKITFLENRAVLSVVDFDCIVRGANRQSVIYKVRQ